MKTFSQKIALVLALGGLILPAAPGSSQDSEEFQTTGGKKKHRKHQARPIELGTSGSNVRDVSAGFCCNGTLGALVEKDGVQYVISNNHVIGRSNSARPGEAIIQPGYADQDFCPAGNDSADTVARFTSRKRIKWGADKINKVDLAIAEVVPGAVKANGEILKIGVPGSDPARPFVGMRVQKSGRTTGHTRGVVTAVDVTVIIEEFPLDCAGTDTRTAIFSKQIIIAGEDGKRFLDSGDSGSMVYEDSADCPAPVGLLFAGSGDLGAASPATEVLKFAKRLKPKGGTTRFVGCQSAGFETSSVGIPGLEGPRIREASGALEGWRKPLLDDPGIQAVGIGMTMSGPVGPAIYVFSTEEREAILERLPETIRGFPLEVVETDKFVAYCGGQ